MRLRAMWNVTAIEDEVELIVVRRGEG
jgi:hypothetical protein